MAEKEIILIARSTDYTITDTDKGPQFDGKIALHCANVMPRQEAIKRIAKAIEYNLNGSSFNSLAEAILNTLFWRRNENNKEI